MGYSLALAFQKVATSVALGGEWIAAAAARGRPSDALEQVMHDFDQPSHHPVILSRDRCRLVAPICARV
jgi:hypothetical protein